MKQALELKINGETHDLLLTPNVTLLEAIRDHVGLWGTKAGCGMGTCGACTVLLEEKPILSCITLAVECHGKEITTIEGLSEGVALSSLQEAFVRAGAVQCGYCSPGMILSGTALLRKNPRPTVADIKKALEGNLCRCTGYNTIIDAVLDAGTASSPQLDQGEKK
ncbi:MAG: (2Fe-2S)-binding protein [Deltaproteobacteria bacterium]|jgi:aerobic carbon-monoxide dehydrogenase small subunit|nr:(2Fe-2S)-binding protein [Deltaproteobacteria bacterium]MBT4637353.1 (2Fe-2S)-binding protein [Deltaproteobacteria bacterium]MBT6500877.1 (2Fe-2S)-binding protein [Deltaproteobacteria bacterium]MBT6613394.1 (2Fe-2S)-binding protein [Deltaproteobacteria bacterium]MBT7150973.1 (2Fe-2S)-binding protein [Deltaproteobacteria bacterium]